MGLSQEWEWKSASLCLPPSHLTFSLTPSAPGLEDRFQFSDHLSWQSEREKVEAVTDFIFLCCKMTVDSDRSHEAKRCLLLGRKAITNVDIVLKGRDVTLPAKVLWGCRIVWCTLTSWYLVSLLPVSIIHASDIFLVGFWSWEISFIMWGCRGWGWQAAGTWVSVSHEMVGFPAPIGWPGASQSICTR